MLLELPTADEIDELAEKAPSVIVRRYEYDLVDRDIDLNYTPCKGEVVVVARRDGGVFLVKDRGAVLWTLPCARIAMNETPSRAAHRVARDRCGIAINEPELKALYDVTRHYRNVSVKRLFVVYGCTAEHEGTAARMEGECSLHTGDLDELPLEEIDAQALSDCL